jgi:DNA-binding transcriptional regulator LsrR (DeoR family)
MASSTDSLLSEVEMMRKLMVLALLKSGMTQAQLGAALGVHRTQIGRMFPSGALADLQGKPSKTVRKTGAAENGGG